MNTSLKDKILDLIIPYRKIGRIMAEANTEFNMDSLLDGTLDDLADLPAFEPYRPGVHAVVLNIVQDKATFKVKLKLVETKELSNSNDKPQEPGTEVDVLYNMTNEYGQGGFKALLASLNETFKKTTNREIIEAAQGAECLVVTSVTESKKNKGVFYTNIKEISVI